jgi:hypothetical protein
MSNKYNLGQIFGSINKMMTSKLQVARETAGHPGDMGDSSESDWVSLFNAYLPQRYQTVQCHVIDSMNTVSEQIDVAIIDRQYTPFVWQHNNISVVPVEAVYAVFEVKQNLSKGHIDYAHKKIASVRQLHKTSLRIPHAGGVFDAKPNISIIGGLLTLTSDYSPFFSVAAENALSEREEGQAIDIGCVANEGVYQLNLQAGYYESRACSAPVTVFMLELIALLQELGTVPMIDVRAYAKWIEGHEEATDRLPPRLPRNAILER